MIKGDKIKLVKEFGGFKEVGTVCTVSTVNPLCFIFSYFTKDGIKQFGFASCNEYVKYFEPVIEEDKPETPKRTWSNWRPIMSDKYYDLNEIRFEMKLRYQLLYRTNGKKIQVKSVNPELKAEASCCKEDKFDVDKGLNLAEKRLIVKLLDYRVKEMAKNM